MFDGMDFELFEGTNDLKDVLEKQINKNYYSTKYEYLLSDNKLDDFVFGRQF